MSEKEAIARLEWLLDKGILAREDEEPVKTILQLLEKKDNRIDELEKALVDEDLKHRDKINKAIEYTKRRIRDDYYCRKSDFLIDNLLEILEE